MNPAFALVGGLLPLVLGGPMQRGPDHLDADQDSLFHFARPAMGTTAEIFLYARSGEVAAELSEAAFAEIERVEAALSAHHPNSEVSRINRDAASEPVTTDPEVFSLVRLALSLSQRTRGAFDITVGPLIRAWRGSTETGIRPTKEVLSSALARTGWFRVALDSAGRSIRFLESGVEIDLGGIGKGAALDRAAEKLRYLGVEAGLLGLGQSSYLAVGAPPGKAGWVVSIRDPETPGNVLTSVQLRDRALSTSGSSERHTELNGQRFSHIIDPRTGHPVTATTQVTVTAPTAAEADAFSTALLVVGRAEAEDILAEAQSCQAYLLDQDEDGTSVTTIRWTEATAPPLSGSPGKPPHGLQRGR